MSAVKTKGTGAMQGNLPRRIDMRHRIAGRIAAVALGALVLGTLALARPAGAGDLDQEAAAALEQL
jgi:hypothetical protein